MRFATVFVLIALIAANSDAGRRRGERTGTIKDNTYVDADFGFSISIYEKWKGTAGKVGDTCRLTIIDKYMGEDFERNGGTDAYYISAPSKVEIWIVSASDSVRDMITAISADSSNQPLHWLYRKAVQSNEARAVLQEVKDTHWEEISYGNYRGMVWSGLYRYTLRDGERSFDLHVGVHLYGLRLKQNLLFVLVSYDPAFGNQVKEESVAMLKTLTFVD